MSSFFINYSIDFKIREIKPIKIRWDSRLRNTCAIDDMNILFKVHVYFC